MFYPSNPHYTHSIMTLRRKEGGKKKKKIAALPPSPFCWVDRFSYLFSEEEKHPIGKEVLLAFNFLNPDYTLLQQMLISSYINTSVL